MILVKFERFVNESKEFKNNTQVIKYCKEIKTEYLQHPFFAIKAQIEKLRKGTRAMRSEAWKLQTKHAAIVPPTPLKVSFSLTN